MNHAVLWTKKLKIFYQFLSLLVVYLMVVIMAGIGEDEDVDHNEYSRLVPAGKKKNRNSLS